MIFSAQKPEIKPEVAPQDVIVGFQLIRESNPGSHTVPMRYSTSMVGFLTQNRFFDNCGAGAEKSRLNSIFAMSRSRVAHEFA